MMFAFGKPLWNPVPTRSKRGEPWPPAPSYSTSLPPVRATFLRLFPCNRTQVGASSPGKFQACEGAFPNGYRRKQVVCVRDCAFRRMSILCEVIYGNRESFRAVCRRQSRQATSHFALSSTAPTRSTECFARSSKMASTGGIKPSISLTPSYAKTISSGLPGRYQCARDDGHRPIGGAAVARCSAPRRSV